MLKLLFAFKAVFVVVGLIVAVLSVFFTDDALSYFGDISGLSVYFNNAFSSIISFDDTLPADFSPISLNTIISYYNILDFFNLIVGIWIGAFTIKFTLMLSKSTKISNLTGKL